MRRVNVVFLALIAGAVLSGGAAGAGFGTKLATFDTISLVEDQVGSNVTELKLDNRSLRITVRLTNPTRFAMELHGTFLRVFDRRQVQLAYGAGQRVDGGDGTVPARGRLTVEYHLGLTPRQSDRLQDAIDGGSLRLNVVHSLTLRGESFEVARTGLTVSGEADG